MKFIILAATLLCSGTVFASEACSLRRAEGLAIRSALAIEAINGGTPLSYEAYSMSSRFDTFGVILSYSGVQKTYFVTVRSADCQVARVEKH